MRHSSLSLPRASLAAAVLACAVDAQILQPQPAAVPPLIFPAMPIQSLAADVDGDGDQDLLTVSDNRLTVHVQQAGAFVGTSFYQAYPTFMGIAAGHLNGDAYIDLVVNSSGLNATAPQVHWGSPGSFLSATPFSLGWPAGSFSSRSALGDVDNDGDLDVVHAINGALTNSSALWLNQGGNSFVAAGSGVWPGIAAAYAVPHLKDLDGDGWLDCLLLSSDQTSTVRLLWNNGGTFAQATTAEFPSLQGGYFGVVQADFDGDTDLDLVLGGWVTSGALLPRVGVRQFALGPTAATGANTLAVMAADADDDGDQDLVVVTRDQIEVRTNDGLGTFTRTSTCGDNINVVMALAADLDQDGDEDLLRASGDAVTPGPVQSNASIAWTVKPGRFEFDGLVAMPQGAQPWLIADMNGDHLPDLLVVAPGPTLQVAENRGGGSFAYRFAQRTAPSGPFPFFGMATVDLFGDGFPEWLGLGLTSGFFANVGGTVSTTLTPLPPPPVSGYHGAVGIDLDGDGDRDLVAVHLASGVHNALRVLRNQGGTFVDATASSLAGPGIPGSNGAVLRAGDLDGDLDEDVWVCSTQSQIWLNQSGVLTFVPGAITPDGFGGSAPAIGDVDRDGDLDLYVDQRVLRNNGNGTFVTDTTSLAGGAMPKYLADLDDDGDLDVFGAGVCFWNNGNGTFAPGASPTPAAIPNSWLVGTADFDLDGDVDVLHNDGSAIFVLRNRLRDLELIGTGRLGTSLEFRYSCQPGQLAQPIAVWADLALARIQPVLVPWLGWVQIDPLTAMPIGPFLLLSGSGQVSYFQPLPVSPPLVGLVLAAQPLEWRGPRLLLGNCVSMQIGR
ncbi:MAG TPA: VCBS repeat-containing protein [Planctomycetota bacterium]